MSRGAEAVAESLLSDEGAIAWAAEEHKLSKRWPTRRWRVDTQHVGNSRLLGRPAAERTHRRYGGELRELIPSYAAYLESKGITGRRTQVRIDAEELGVCPHCEVEAGQPCKQPSGSLCRPHARRIRTSDFGDAAKDLPKCPVCGVAAGDACRTPGSQLRKPHVRRTGQSRHHKLAADLDVCPTCHVKEGEPCHSKNGSLRVPHVRRRQKGSL
jgi:ribosomal protein L32